MFNRNEGTGQIHAKLIDFECSARFSNCRMTQNGTLGSLAPEVITEAYKTEKIDSWGVGVILFNLLTKSQPFQVKGDDASDTYDRTAQRIKSVNYILPPELSADAKNLIGRIFVFNPQHRLSVQQIREHAFIKRYVEVSTIIEPDAEIT
jgi:serine/threonine protein kinase